jgi:ubiquinone/menaquinone biosynthesis C-methylase UbiE
MALFSKLLVGFYYMKLPKRILSRSDSRMVQRINEIYHDLESTCYDQRHRDMVSFEQTFWLNAAKKYLITNAPIVCLDYGTGTGFVPATIGRYLKQIDLLICCDISAEMLKICQSNLQRLYLPCKSSFRKIDDGKIPVDTDSVDVITINSVLHHIVDLNSFSQECRRVLKKGGALLVSHEPNRKQSLSFVGNTLLFFNTILYKPRALFIRAAEKLPSLEGFMRLVLSAISKGYRIRNKMLFNIARQLKEEGFVDFEPRGTEIQQIVDFHSQHGQGFKPIEFETYNHLGFFPNNRAVKAIDHYLKAKWPDSGKQIRFVLQRL